MLELFNYQKDLLGKLRRRRAAIFLRYGSGKSRIALEYSKVVEGEAGIRVFIICLKHNILTWELEIEKWLPGLKTFKDMDKTDEFLWENESEGCALILTYGSMRTKESRIFSLTQEYRVGLMILDESTKIKNQKAKQTQSALRLSKFIENKVILTGNPMPENPEEIWTQFQFLYGDRNPLGMTFYKFIGKWFIKSEYDFVLRLDKRKEFMREIERHSVYLYGENLAEYKEKTDIKKELFTIEYYEMHSKQRELLEHLYTYWSLPDNLNEEEEYNYTMSLANKAQQIASGFYYSGEDKIPTDVGANPKLDLLENVLEKLFEEDPNRKIIIWRAFSYDTVKIFHRIQDKYSTVCGHDREEILKFHDDSTVKIIIMPVQIAQGLNELVVADTDIYFSNTYSQEMRAQAEARIARVGQKSDIVTHIDLCCPDMIDCDIVTALQGKSLTPAKLETIVNKYINA